MAFTVSIKETFQTIGAKIIVGTYTSDGGTAGGDITLPLQKLYHLTLQPKGSSILANQPVVNETLPLQGKYNVSATIVTTANEVGSFQAIGV